MYQKEAKAKTKRNAATILTVLLFVLPGCVSPDAVKTDIQGIRNDMGVLEKIVDQKADNTVVADSIDQINNKIEQTTQMAEELSLWRKSIQAETINYGGAGWVVVGTSVVVLIFVVAGILLIKAFMKRGAMLSLVTRAIKEVGKNSPYAVSLIKDRLKKCVHDGHNCEQDRRDLGKFAEKNGNFAKQG